MRILCSGVQLFCRNLWHHLPDPLLYSAQEEAGADGANKPSNQKQDSVIAGDLGLQLIDHRQTDHLEVNMIQQASCPPPKIPNSIKVNIDFL